MGGVFILLLVISFTIAFFATPLIRFIASRFGIYGDLPRKPNQKPTPLLGGMAVFFAFTFVAFQLLDFASSMALDQCKDFYPPTCAEEASAFLTYGFILLGVCVLVVGGVLDDIFHLSPERQVIWPVLAALTVIAGGVGQDNITNPLYFFGLARDPLIHFNVRTINVFGFELTLFTDLFTFLWLMVLMYATKLLDGLNGLVSGITVIGAMILFFTSATLGQPFPAYFSFILVGSYLGFLPHNLFGKIFLGESGSTIAGFLLGVLSLLGSAKISITLLVLGLPILDLLWVMYERKFQAKTSPFVGDARHLHFKLVRSGLSERSSVVLLWGISLVFGALGLVLQGVAHGALLIVLIALMAGMLFVTHRKTTKELFYYEDKN